MKMNIKKLIKTCKLKTESVLNGERYKYIDNGGKLLAIAHLDYVGTWINPSIAKLENDTYIFAQNLDDRLGVYIIMDILSKIPGYPIDVLLTTDEEIGMSTMEDFLQDYPDILDKYNWIFEVDRNGTDAVTYDLDTPEFLDALREYFRIGHGSFSDICTIEYTNNKTLPCAVNFGCGYYKEHTPYSYMSLNDAELQIKRMVKFIKKYYYKKFSFDNTYVLARKELTSFRNYGSYYRDGVIEHNVIYADDNICELCWERDGKYHAFIDKYVCDQCLSNPALWTQPFTDNGTQTKTKKKTRYACDLCGDSTVETSYDTYWDAWLCKHCQKTIKENGIP